MPSFKYRVKDRSGQVMDGEMTGDDSRAVTRELQKAGYFVLRVEEERAKPQPGTNPFTAFVRWVVAPIFGGAAPFDLSVFYRQLVTMFRAGMPISLAMSSLQRQGANARLKKIAQETTPYLQSGGRLSEAFARYPWMFPDLHVFLIRSGEDSGMLESMLERLATYMEREHAVRQKLRVMTLYPKLLVLAVIFIPTLPILVLGTPMQYLMATVPTVLILGGAILGIWVLYRLLYQIPAFSYIVDMLKISIPKVGRMARMLAMSKFYRTVAAMYSAGASLPTAVAHASKSCGNAYLGKHLATVIPSVETGTALSEALERTDLLPDTALNMLRTGEHTGNVDEMLDKVAEYTENEAEVMVSQSTVILGVVLLLGVAVYIGFFVVGFYQGYFGGMLGGQ